MADPGDFLARALPPGGPPPPDGDDFWAGGGSYEGVLGPWSAITINGQWFPGQTGITAAVIPVFIDDGKKAYKEDKQKVRGQHGHRQIYNGYIAARFPVRCRIMTAAQWAAFKAYLPQIDPEIRAGQFAALSGKTHAASAKALAARGELAKIELQSLQQAGPTRDAAEAQRLAVQGPGAPQDPAQAQKLAAQFLAAQAKSKQAAAALRNAADKSSFSVGHPILTAYGITRVDIIEVSFPKEADGRMVRDVTILMQQVTQLKDTGSRVVSTKGGLRIGVNASQVIDRAVDFNVDGQVFAEPRRP